MRRGLFPAQAAGLLAVLAGMLWLLARKVPGDRAAFFGALAFFLLAFLGCALYLFQLLDTDSTASELTGAEFNCYLRERLMPQLRAKVRPYRFILTFLTGMWIGIMAQHPWLMGACALLAEIAIGGAMDALPRFRVYGTARVVGTLSAAIGLGSLIHSWLS